MALASGIALRVPPTEGADVSFLPPDHPVAEATRDFNELFSDSGDFRTATLIFRGDALTPGGLSQMSALIDDIAGDPDVSALLASSNPIIAPAPILAAALRTDNLGSLSQNQINAVRAAPRIRQALDAMTGTDADGSPVAIANIRLANTEDESVENAERRISEIAQTHDGPLRVSSLSPTTVKDEYDYATERGMVPLIDLALLLIAALLSLFTRSALDMALTLLGLILAIACTVGVEGWLGPNGLGLVGPPSSLTAMAPIILIGLTVDYAIQIVSHYRERLAEGRPVAEAARAGVSNVATPLTLAAVTTIASLLASLFSPIGVIGDFGVIAGLGVGMSLVIMLTLLPASRTIIDRRRESRDALPPALPISNALPGVPRMTERLGGWVTRRPAPYLVAVIIITIGLGYAATDLDSEFSVKDILPRGGDALKDMNTLEAAVGRLD